MCSFDIHIGFYFLKNKELVDIFSDTVCPEYLAFLALPFIPSERQSSIQLRYLA